jgi:ribose 1,5-bisphosphokinase PhnN
VRIFIAPPSWAELERRLTERGTDSPEKIQKRLLRAKVEFQTAHTYDYFVINDYGGDGRGRAGRHHDRGALQAPGADGDHQRK